MTGIAAHPWRSSKSLGSVESSAKLGQSSPWRWMPAKAKIGCPGSEAQVCRFAPAGPDQRAKQVAGTRHRSSRSEEHTSELQSLMRISYAVFCLKKKKKKHQN